MRTKYRVLPTAVAELLSEDGLDEARAYGWLLPISGADGEGDDGADDTDNSDDSGGNDDNADSGDSTKNDSAKNDSSKEDDDGDDDGHPDDVLELSRSEYERLRRIAREKDKADKQRERLEKQSKDRLRKEQGEWEELVKEKDEQIQTVEAERDESKYQLDAFKRRIRVGEAAKRLGYKDPEDAFRFLSDEDTEDDTSTERALRRLAKSKKYLVDQRQQTGAPVNGDGGGLTLDQIKNMSESEINANWSEVQKAMAATG